MAEFDCSTNTMKKPVPYPNGFNARTQSVCGSNDSEIVVVDGQSGKLMAFNPNNKKYGAAVPMPPIGHSTASLMIDGNVHSEHGQKNSSNQYLVYSMATGRVTEFKPNLKSHRMREVSITKQADDSEFYKFGGWDDTTKKCTDSFFVGKLQNGKADKPIIWKQADHFKLKKPLLGCGVIQRYPFIVIFGGETTGDKALDDIYILDIRSKSGWVQSPIKCPKKNMCVKRLKRKKRKQRGQ